MILGDVYGFWAPRKSQEHSRRVGEVPEAPRRAQGVPRRGPEMELVSFRKIGKMSSEMRLAASEGR